MTMIVIRMLMLMVELQRMSDDEVLCRRAACE
jgi:hypothetical protein